MMSKMTSARNAFLLILIFMGLGIGMWRHYVGTEKDLIVVEKPDVIQEKKDTEMANRLWRYTKELNGKYAVLVYRFDTKKSYGVNEKEVVPARSVIKVPIILTAFRLGVAEKYSLLLERMGKNSDNVAQLNMEKYLGKEEILKTLDILGMISTSFEENTTTAEDLVWMWKYIYENERFSEIKKYLVESIYEDRISRGIPVGIELVHKVGTDISVWNDSGIILSDKPYILVILNQGVVRAEAEKSVPEIAKMVWDYEINL